jgi:hypothetical protein
VTRQEANSRVRGAFGSDPSVMMPVAHRVAGMLAFR